jgi:eukaryotic-like serine/threonine-protein kinase
MAESHLEFTKPSHVVGRYALYGRLAAGGMATVHLGRVLEVDGTTRTVAVKRLHPQFCKDPEFVAMFIDEARLAARIKHPNVVETVDILTMGQELLLVMEYIRGECFSKLLRAARRKNLEPSIGVVGTIASGLLHGLHAAHEARDENGEFLNVVHRDISPQNVMIDVDGMVKVLDFGVAKASARIQITRDGQMKGKLSYMSPEQLQGLPVDRRADVFACGVVLWEALTRRRLFVGEDASEVLRKILRDEVPPPSHWMAGLSPEIDAVVLRALSKDPEQRYQTAEELALDVEKVIDLAPPGEVGAWLDSVAGEILGKRERLLQEIERLGVGDVVFDSSGGSITDSDTFQRIQSWAEREAARAAGEAQASFSHDFEDTEAEPTKTVADARCVDDVLPPDTSSSALEVASSTRSGSGLVEPSVAGAEAAAAEARVARAEQVQQAAPALPDIASGGTASGVVASVEPRRRERRWLYVMAAAAGVLGVAAVAFVGVPSSTRVSTNALLPESPLSSDRSPDRGAPEATGLAAGLSGVGDGTRDGAIAAVAANKPAGDTDLALDGAAAGRDGARAGRITRPSPAGSTSMAPEPSEPSASSAEAKSRVAQALTQPAKERVPSSAAPPPKRAPKRATLARRAKPAATGSASATGSSKSAATKVDCRQPFWIDEGGIRRLKMACL